MAPHSSTLAWKIPGTEEPSGLTSMGLHRVRHDWSDLAAAAATCFSLEKTWCWEGLGAGGEGDNRGWDGWMALPTWWTWVWVNSGSWWWTGRAGLLWFMEVAKSQTRLSDWTELNWMCFYSLIFRWKVFLKVKEIEFLLASPYSWRRQWHPTPVLLSGKSHGWRSLVGCSPWGH